MLSSLGSTPRIDRRAPASILLITPAHEVATRAYITLEREFGSRVWLCHEGALTPALHLLGACKFRLILLDPAIGTALPEAILGVVKQAAPETPLVVLAGGADLPGPSDRAPLGTAAMVPRGSSAALLDVVRKILGFPAPNARGS